MPLSALTVKRRVQNILIKIPGVNGVGIAPAIKVQANLGIKGIFEDQPEKINVYVVKLTTEIEAQIPKEIDGVEINIVEIGEIVAFDIDRTIRTRPAVPGISIGNVDITAGTFGAVVIDNETGLKAILSNAHVFTTDVREATSSLEIVQPGIFDGGILPDDIIATLTKWIILNENRLNFVDCAIATPLNQEDIDEEIVGIGPINGVETPFVDMEITKSGRTSGVTNGTILDTNMLVSVNYRGQGLITFDDQILATSMGAPGDSGSLLMSADNHKAVGLLFAGSSDSTIFCKIQNVINNLNISIAGVGPEVLEPDPDAPKINLATIAIALAGIGLLTIQQKKK